MGIILAVAGSAVGFGNFLRFPGLAAEYGGAAFIIAYFVSLLLLGLPVGFAEWAMGRYAGSKKAHTLPSFLWVVTRSTSFKYAGTLGVSVVLTISGYYLCLESWTFAYTFEYMTQGLSFSSSKEYQDFFAKMVGMNENGSVFTLDFKGILFFLALTFSVNFFILYRGIRKGIEFFCKWAMPALILISLIMTVRVLTLGTPDASHPERNIEAGMAYMWEPSKMMIEKQLPDKSWEALNMVSLYNKEGVAEAREQVAASDGTLRLQEVGLMKALMRPRVWLEAAGQMFFSLSIGYGTILCYASYLRPKDDIALSSLSAFTANEFCEVGIGGLMTVPAAVAFLGLAGAAGQSIFALAFNVLPQVFAAMPGGAFFGLLFFILLSLAAVTSSISIIQPGVAFLEEFLGWKRKRCLLLIFSLLSLGALIITWFSKGLLALDTLNFFAGTIFPLLLALFLIVVFAWFWGVDKGFEELNKGALVRIPSFFKGIMKYVTPLILIVIFLASVIENIFIEQVACLKALHEGQWGAWMSVLWMLLLICVCASVVYRSRKFK